MKHKNKTGNITSNLNTKYEINPKHETNLKRKYKTRENKQ